jgi:hypothetical protein
MCVPERKDEMSETNEEEKGKRDERQDGKRQEESTPKAHRLLAAG